MAAVIAANASAPSSTTRITLRFMFVSPANAASALTQPVEQCRGLLFRPRLLSYPALMRPFVAMSQALSPAFDLQPEQVVSTFRLQEFP